MNNIDGVFPFALGGRRILDNWKQLGLDNHNRLTNVYKKPSVLEGLLNYLVTGSYALASKFDKSG